MRVYLAGPMRGYPNDNRDAFNRIAGELRKLGFEVINPAELDADFEAPNDWRDYYRRDLPYLVTCDVIVVMPGWRKSTGATLEVTVAVVIGMPVLEWPSLKPIPVEQLPSIKHAAT